MKCFIATALLLLVAGNALGQSEIFAVHYDMSLPGQHMNGYIDQMSWRGIGVDSRWFLTPNMPIALGVSAGWQVFDEETNETIVFDNGALSGKQRRYINSFPFMLTGHYYFGDKDRIWLFAGGGIGTYIIDQRFEAGVFTFQKTNWHFGLCPELGFQIHMSAADLFVSGRYNFAFAAGTSLNGGAKEWDYWGINVGVAWCGW